MRIGFNIIHSLCLNASLFGASIVAGAAEPNFDAQVIDGDIQIGYGLAIGDVNGDGKDDILLADKQDFFWYESPSWKRHLLWTVAQGEARQSMRDNVCIAARDIDGDGKVEVAVGTNWNPGETVSEEKSGGVWFLGSLGNIRPVKLEHEPTTHRMAWVQGKEGFSLVVAPLHGRGNKGGAGENGTRIYAYEAGENAYASSWTRRLINESFHKTHNLDAIPNASTQADSLALTGGEGLSFVTQSNAKWNSNPISGLERGAGEVRVGRVDKKGVPSVIATIEPMHGNNVVSYARRGDSWQRSVLDDSLNQGHALVIADILNTGSLQIVAGWRNRDARNRVGIRLYQSDAKGNWQTSIIDDDQMACEDIKTADLDGDGDLDLVASGRSTKNVIIYWNRMP